MFVRGHIKERKQLAEKMREDDSKAEYEGLGLRGKSYTDLYK